jgi:serine/threonine-protein kinase RsbW
MNPIDSSEQGKRFFCNAATIKDVRKWIADLLLKRNTPAPIVDDLVLAASEAVTNSVTHSYESTHEGIVDVRVLIRGNVVHLVIRDYGTSVATKEYQPPDLSAPQEGGYGLFLIKALTDSVTVIPLERGTEIQMTKKLP